MGNCPQIGMVTYDSLRPDRSLTGRQNRRALCSHRQGQGSYV